MKFNALHNILSMDDNASVYRSDLGAITAPYVPYIGIHTKDLIFLLDGNKDFLERTDGDGSTDGEINFFKFYKVYQTVSSIMSGVQGGVYDFGCVEKVRTWFMTGAPRLENDNIFLWSRRYCRT